MRADGLDGVLRATGLETASPQRAGQCRQRRRKRALINPHRKNQNMLGRIQTDFNNLAFLSMAIKASSTVAKPCPKIGLCATKTMSTGCVKSC